MAHTVIRPCNTRDTHPDEANVRTGYELCQAIRAENLVFPRGRVGAAFEGGIDAQAVIPESESVPGDGARS